MSELTNAKILNFYTSENLRKKIDSLLNDQCASAKHIELSSQDINDIENQIFDHQPDLLFFDLDYLSDEKFEESLGILKNIPLNPKPVLVGISSRKDKKFRKISYQKEIEEYFHIDEDFEHLGFRVSVLLKNREIKKKLGEAMNKLSVSNQELQDKNKSLEALSLTDDLTGLSNVRYMTKALEGMYMLLDRYDRPFSLLMLDLDHFKDVNDNNDHLIGSTMLKEVARVIEEHTRGTDIKVRYGGDEYVVAMPETYMKSALIVAERLREKIAQLSITVSPSRVIKITASIGVTCFNRKRHSSYVDILRDADVAMYAAKKKGRNRVEVYTDKVLGYDEAQSALVSALKHQHKTKHEIQKQEREEKKKIASKNVPTSLYWYWVKLKRSKTDSE